MNNIQRVIVFLFISSVAFIITGVNDYGELNEEGALVWLVITAITGFFLFKTKD